MTESLQNSRRNTWEKILITLIIVLAVLSRFLMIGARGMSHDEINHVTPSYSLYQGNGYAHNPVTHGPFQFHLLALSYFLLGDSDFSSRVPAALFSLAAVVFALFAYRRYLGKIGSLLAGFFLLISPSILYYGRYTRNEAFIELFAVLTFYGLLRYYDRRDHASLYLLAVVTALQFTTKEVAYIYTAQLLLFCGILFLTEVWKMSWKNAKSRANAFSLLLGAAFFFVLALLLKSLFATEENKLPLGMLAAGAVGILILIGMIVYAVRCLGWKEIRRSPSFNLIVFIGALILPQLTAFPVSLLGWDPLDYSASGILHTGVFLIAMLVLSFAIGLWWNRAVFLKSAIAFYGIFIFFYTTVFSNIHGFFTGIIGGLGYWLSQQSVQRGGQPLYYYALIQLPVYEFAALAGTLLALVIAIRQRHFLTLPGDLLSARPVLPEPTETETAEENAEEAAEEAIAEKMEILPVNKPTLLPVLPLFLYWALTALAAYSVAGEKMPWLTVHIALPLAFSAAWGVAYLIETFPWKKLFSAKGLLGLLGAVLAVIGLCSLDASLNGTPRPFSGKDLEQLRATFRLVTILLMTALGLGLVLRNWKGSRAVEILKTLSLTSMAVLAVLQARTAFTSSFINYEYASELLVYAHGAPGAKTAVEMIDDIAERSGAGKALKIAYDNDANYPFWWYLRDYSNKNYFGENNPTRELRNYDVIVANTSKEGRLEPIVKDAYYRYEFIRLWWPNQDYFNLTPSKIWNALTNPKMREALFHIWLDRDYSYYASVTGKTSLTAETWEPSSRFVMFVRKDLMNRMWLLSDAAYTPDESGSLLDEEEERFTALQPSRVISGDGAEGLSKPRNMALSPDGERIYVLDSGSNTLRIFDSEGTQLNKVNSLNGVAFNEPWGIATAPDGSVYIADTWNNRIVKTDADGNFLLEWYAANPDADPRGFYGPRSVAVSSDGTVYVCDTGYKRILAYDENGTFLRSFGTSGMGMGELDEPVGIALLDDTHLAVADTWNQRVQVFDISSPELSVSSAFEVEAWYSQSLNNKPYIAGSMASGSIFITDPEGTLVHQYDIQGTLIRTWNAAGGDIDTQSMPIGIALAPDGSVWVADMQNNTVNQFVLPE